MQLYAVSFIQPSSGIKFTAYSCICWLLHIIYYDARNHKHKIYLLIKYIISVPWRVAKRLSYIEEALCLKVNFKLPIYVVIWK